MGIKHFQQFNVGGDHRDQISLIPPFQLRRTELPERCEHLMTDDRQQLERDKMIAVLLPIVEDPPHHRHHDQRDEQSLRLHPQKRISAQGRKSQSHCLHGRLQKDVHQSVPRQDRQEDRAQIPDRPKHNSQQHHRQERLHQADQPPHDPDAASSLICIHADASFPYCSSSI